MIDFNDRVHDPDDTGDTDMDPRDTAALHEPQHRGIAEREPEREAEREAERPTANPADAAASEAARAAASEAARAAERA